MSTKQLIFGLCALLTVLAIAAIIAVVSTIRYERNAEINAQSEIEHDKVVQEEKTKRTKERMKLFPWAKDEKEEEDASDNR